MTDTRWAKLRRLGLHWLEHAIDQALVPLQPLKRRRGRPPAGAASTAGSHRSIRLDSPHWARLQRLGPAWLDRAIDRA